MAEWVRRSDTVTVVGTSQSASLRNDEMRSTLEGSALEFSATASAHVRLQLLRCQTGATVQWRTAPREISVIWVRNKGGEACLSLLDGTSKRIASGRAHFWLYLDWIDTGGNISGQGAFDCAWLFLDRAVIALSQLPALAQPLSGFAHEPLRRVFDELVEQLKASDNLAPVLTEGLAVWVLRHAARMSRQPPRDGGKHNGGLAPWQLRRATEIFGANLAEKHLLEQIARVCKLSPSHFRRAFKQSTGLPPHQWILNARVKLACDLLLRSSTTLAEIALACGFSDQGHFTRTFSRLEGTSPGAWRRHHQA